MDIRVCSVFYFILIWTFSSCIEYENSIEWLHSLVLDRQGNYVVHWTVDSDIINFRVDVRTKGYVGFGLSANGAMAGSDIVTGWIADGIVHFQDRHGLGNFMPEMDDSQDWEAICGEENSTHTMLTFRRKLRTCDNNDIVIDESTLRVIYAYSDQDPSEEESISYHGTHRGSRSVNLLQSDMKTTYSTLGLKYFEIRSPNIELNTYYDTTYWCNIVGGPELPSKNHIVKIEPVIKAGNEAYVHHMVVYECIGPSGIFQPLVNQEGHFCYHPNMPEAMKQCEGVFAAWGVGGEAIVFPEHVGLPLNSRPKKYYLLETHYDNPALHKGIMDNSGLRFYYTPMLREYDAGTLMVGSAVTRKIIIPPKLDEYIVAGHGHPECFKPAMPPDGINIFGMLLHTHLLGRRIKVRHFRGNIELPPIADNKHYDFNYQEFVYLPHDIKFKANDQMVVECTYNSSDRFRTTFGGITTKEEMCLAFVQYYPRIERFASLSEPSYNLIAGLIGVNLGESTGEGMARVPEGYSKTIEMYDFSKVNVDMIGNALRYSPHNVYCYIGDGDKTSVSDWIAYPMNIIPYEEPDYCSDRPIPVMKVKSSADILSTFIPLVLVATYISSTVIF